MKPEKVRKIISEQIGDFSSPMWLGLLLIVFANSWYFAELKGTYPMIFLIPTLSLLIIAGYLAKMLGKWKRV